MALDKRQRILNTAMTVFSEYGYRRVNMKEIARELGISRPGLYLYFKTKEEIFNAVIALFGEITLGRAKAGINQKKTLEEQLHFAFEVFMVEVFVHTLHSPEAKEISESSLAFANEALNKTYKDFEIFIASILKFHGISKQKTGFSSDRIAHLLVSSARGFKTVAADGLELRKMIHDLIRLSTKPPLK